MDSPVVPRSSERAASTEENPASEIEGPGTERADTVHLDRSLVRGVAWTGAARWSTQLLSWAATFILARLLTPDDFGIVGLAALYIGFVALVNEMGLGTAVVRFRDLTPLEVSQINSLALLLGVAGFAASCLLAIPVGLFFASRELPIVIVVMSLSFILSSFRTVPIGLLQREFRFKFLASVEAGQAALLAVTQATLAILGLRYWSLVLGELSTAAVSAIVLVAARHRGFAVPRWRSLKRVITFTTHLLVMRITWYIYSNADFMVVAKILGIATNGLYKMAWNFSTSPMQKITEIVTRVTPSVFSAVQKDLSALRRYVLNITEGLALVTFPLTVGLSLVADDFVRFALGPKWEGVILPLRLLAFYVSFRTISTIPSQVLMVIGETAYLMRNGLFAVIVMPAAFLIGCRWGTAGVATAWIVAYPIVVLPVYVRLFRRTGMELGSYFKSIWPALSGTVAMLIAVLLVRLALPASLASGARLVIEVAAGGVVYVVSTFALHRERLSRVREAVWSLRG